MSISVRFRPTRSDLVSGGFVGLLTRPMLLASSLAFFGVLPIATAIATVWISNTHGKAVDWLEVSGLLLIPLVMLGGMPLLPLWLFRKSRALQGEHIYRFGIEGMQFVGPGFDNRVDWTIVTGYLESFVGLTLMSDKMPVVTVPRRVLSDDVRGDLVGLLQEKGILSRSRKTKVIK